MENFDVEKLIKYIEPIKDGTNYWLVRTMGGDYYDEYVDKHFIAIGYNEITVDDLNHLPEKEKTARKILQEMLKGRRENIRNTSYPTSQMLRFAREMKVGDIVIVPASSSYKVTFGVIESELYQEKMNLHAALGCPFAKRRNVKWLRTSMRHSLPAELQLMFNSRHIISEIKSYASCVDNFLNDFYTKGDMTYLVLRVRQEDTLSADDFTLVGDLMELFNDYSSKNGLGLTSQDIKMKMSVQSPGDILVFAQSPEGITIIGLIVLFIKGGTFSINVGNFHVEAKSPTIGDTFSKMVKTVNEFLNDRTKRKTIKKLSKKLDNMEIEAPTAIVDMIKQLGTSFTKSDSDSTDEKSI